MAGDEQDMAEAFDGDVIGGEPVTSDEAETEFPPVRPRALQFAESDVTDESIDDRWEQEQPEVWEGQEQQPWGSQWSVDGELRTVEGVDLDDVNAGQQVVIADVDEPSAEEAALHIEDSGGRPG